MENLCPKCGTILRIQTTTNVVKDKKLFVVQELACHNPDCLNNNKIVKIVEHERPVVFE